jgi:hypothetical protein
MLVPYKAWALYKISACDGVNSLNCRSESQRILSGPRPNWSKLRRACNVMLWWSIGRKSSIRTTCNLRLWVVKHLNQRRWLLYIVRAPSRITFFDGAQICIVLIWITRNSIEPTAKLLKALASLECHAGEKYCARVPSEHLAIFRLELQNIGAKKC